MSLNTEIRELDGVRREIRVVVDADTTREAVGKVLKNLRKHARIPGFRPGKAPEALVRSHYQDVLRQEVVERLVRSTVGQALEEAGAEPVHLGEIHDVDLPEQGPLSYTADFEVAPEIDLGEYEGLDVVRPRAEVEDEEVESEIRRFLESQAMLEPVEDREEVQAGDFVLADFIEMPLEEGVEPKIDEDVFMEAGEERHLEELNAALLSGKVGETVAFEVDYPDHHPEGRLAGRSVGYKIRIKGLKRKVVPELDDAIVQEHTSCETAEELRARLREDMEKAKEQAVGRVVRERIINRLLERHEFPAPPTLVREQANRSLRDQIEDVARRGMDPRRLSVDWDEEYAKHLARAERDVKAHFLLEKIGEKEEISVSREEAEAELERLAEARDVPVERLRSELGGDEGLSALEERILRRKILDFLVTSARLTDEESA